MIVRQVEKSILLQILDQHWREHLVTLEHLRQIVGLRGFGQRDPLAEFKLEAFSRSLTFCPACAAMSPAF